jgi:hypothetical protein
MLHRDEPPAERVSLQKKENEEEMLDIQRREGSGDSKSETLIGMKAVAMETVERAAEGLHRARKRGQNWIWMREVSVRELIIK